MSKVRPLSNNRAEACRALVRRHTRGLPGICDPMIMKTITLAAVAFAAAIAMAAADEKKDEKTLGERTKETLEKAKDKTVETGRAIAEGTKEVTKKAIEKTKEAAGTVMDAVTPDADARKVDVNLKENQIDMPTKLAAGKTAFVVRNTGKEKHNFEIQGQGTEKKFLLNVNPDETKVLHVDLKPGAYNASCPMQGHESEGKVMITVE